MRKKRIFHSFEELGSLKPRKRVHMAQYVHVDINAPLPKECKDLNTLIREKRAELRALGLGTVTVIEYSAKVWGDWTSVKESDLPKYEGFQIRKEEVTLDRWSRKELKRSVIE